MNRALISSLFAIGGSVWVYTKMSRQTGGQAKPALIVSGVAALFIFIATFMALGLISD